MSKSIRFRNDIYFDTRGIIHNKKILFDLIQETKFGMIFTSDIDSLAKYFGSVFSGFIRIRDDANLFGLGKRSMVRRFLYLSK